VIKAIGGILLYQTAFKNSIGFFLTIMGFFMIGSLPYLFFRMDALREIVVMLDTGQLRNTLFIYETMDIYVKEYLFHMYETVKDIFNIAQYKYYSYGNYYSLFPQFWDDYKYSMVILGGSLILGLTVAIVITFILMLLPIKLRNIVSKLMYILESFPDILIIFLLQYCFILIYQKTNVLVFDIYSFGDKQPFALPIICLSIFPTIFMSRYLLQVFQEEDNRHYVELAKGKGLKRSRILLVHVLRNCLITLLGQGRVFFWLALSNLLIMEIIFMMNGFLNFMLINGPKNPEIVTFGLIMIYVPFFLFFSLLKLVTSYFNNGVVEGGLS
jgi:peptide/nickel transport system permease protein